MKHYPFLLFGATLFFGSLLVVLLFYPFHLRTRNQNYIAQKELEALTLAEQRKATWATLRQKETVTVPILLYHYVEIVKDENDTIRQSLSITPQVFESQILTLYASGYTPITLDDLSNYFEGISPLPQKPVILTFDDGYADFYTDVLPVLERHNTKAVLFMVSGFLDYTKNYLTTTQFSVIAQSPLVEINAHSVTHANLVWTDLKTAEAEIIQSKAQLEKFLGRSVNHFAYPYGSYTRALADLVKKAGFKTAATVDLGVSHSYEDRFILKRVRPGGFIGQEFLQKIAGSL